jgi:hypothetical protein
MEGNSTQEIEEVKEPTEIDVCIIVPGHNFTGMFLQSFIDTFATLMMSGKTIAFRTAAGSVLPSLRNSLISGTDERGYFNNIPFNNSPYKPKKILFIDSDMLFTPQDAIKLIESEEDIISGWYLRTEGIPICMRSYQGSRNKYLAYEQHEMNGKEVMEVDTTGMGFVCVKYEVLEKIKYPWFQFTQHPSEDDGETYPPLGGEDIWFFNRAVEEGYKVMLDPTVHVGHIKSIPLGVNRE